MLSSYFLVFWPKIAIFEKISHESEGVEKNVMIHK